MDSEIITNNVNNNRAHTFLKLEDAEKHAKSYKGRIVKNPFEKILEAEIKMKRSNMKRYLLYF